MFAEPSCQTSNCRVFTITVNGSPCVSNFDLYANAGYDTAYNVLCPFNISGTSTVTIQLINIAQTAILNALQILPLGTVNNYTTVNQAPTPSPIQWYASGGATYKDTFGATWSYAVEFIYNGQLTSSSSSIANTANPTLYQYAVLTGGVMPIEFAVLSSATYSVTLMFAETVCQHANCRVGNYSVNGVMCLSNFDIWATVGLNAAYNYVCPQTVTGATTITIDVTTVVALACISAIQLLPVGATNNYTKAVPAAPILWYASTSPAYVDTFGQTWNYYTSASIVGATGTYSSSTVANTANQGLYQSYIYATNSGGTMTLLYDVNSTTSYRIMLLFAEFVCTQAGCRVGTYEINDTPCLNSFDIYGVAGSSTAFNVLCPQIISGVSQVVIQVDSIVGSALLNAVEILPVGTTNNYTANAPVSRSVCTYDGWSSPVLGSGVYSYGPALSVSQPWSFPQISGVAQLGSPFDPSSPSTPPDGTQYAYLQMNSQFPSNTIYATVWNANPLSAYIASFYVGMRQGGSPTNASVQVFVDGQQVWSSVPALPQGGGWDWQVTTSFSIPGSNSQITLQTTTNPPGLQDMDFNGFLLSEISPAAQASVTQIGLVPGYLYGFDYPLDSVAGVAPYGFASLPPVIPLQPWTFNGGGIANQGSPYDPTSSPVSCNSYAFLQTSTAGQVVYMSSPWLSPSVGSSYTIQFYYNVRGNPSPASTNAVLAVTVGSNVVWQSSGSIGGSGAWTLVNTSPFVLPNPSGQLLVTVSSTSTQSTDQTTLIDSFIILSA